MTGICLPQFFRLEILRRDCPLDLFFRVSKEFGKGAFRWLPCGQPRSNYPCRLFRDPSEIRCREFGSAVFKRDAHARNTKIVFFAGGRLIFSVLLSYYPLAHFILGEMVEWFKAAVLKTADAQASGSSNLPLSAIFFAPHRFFKSESVYALTTKTRWHKAFYKTYCRVFETHSDRKIRAFSPDFRPFPV